MLNPRSPEVVAALDALAASEKRRDDAKTRLDTCRRELDVASSEFQAAIKDHQVAASRIKELLGLVPKSQAASIADELEEDDDGERDDPDFEGKPVPRPSARLR